MNKKYAVRIILSAWIIIWVIFLIRPYLKKGLLSEYSDLAKLSAEQRRAYVTGKELYGFVDFCRYFVKKPSTYETAGIEKYSIEHRRLRYYLYPNIEKEGGEYIFVYGIKGFFKDGYGIFAKLNDEEYILRRMR